MQDGQSKQHSSNDLNRRGMHSAASLTATLLAPDMFDKRDDFDRQKDDQNRGGEHHYEPHYSLDASDYFLQFL